MFYITYDPSCLPTPHFIHTQLNSFPTRRSSDLSHQSTGCQPLSWDVLKTTPDLYSRKLVSAESPIASVSMKTTDRKSTRLNSSRPASRMPSSACKKKYII